MHIFLTFIGVLFLVRLKHDEPAHITGSALLVMWRFRANIMLRVQPCHLLPVSRPVLFADIVTTGQQVALVIGYVKLRVIASKDGQVLELSNDRQAFLDILEPSGIGFVTYINLQQ